MKRKINIDRPGITADEIAKRKNFDSVLKNSPGMPGKPFFKKPWFYGGIAVVTLATISAVLILGNRQAKTPINEKVVADSIVKVAAFYASEQSKPCISPPLKGLDISYTVFTVDAVEGGELKMPNGSRLVFPANAFADNEGNLLKGKVEIRYREFHDPMEIFVAGIPMTYDSAGTRYHFETAGMMEVLAFQDGESVNMAKGKTVDVELASDTSDPKFNLYKLDTLHHNWSCLGKDRIVAGSPAPVITARDVAADNAQQMKMQKAAEQAQAAVTRLEEEKETRIAELPKPAPAPSKPQQVRKDKFTFNLDVDPKEYPELAYYKGLLFEVGDENKSFTREMYSITWDNATVKEGTVKGRNYLLTLTKGSKKYDLIVYPVYEGKNYEAALNEYQERFNKYSVALEKRKAEEQVIAEAYAKRIDALKKEQERLLREQAVMQKRVEQTMSTEEKALRCFTISEFAVYNCDHPRSAPAVAKFSGELRKDHDVSILCYNVYFVDKKEKALYTFNGSPLKFGYDPAAQNVLWTVEDGVIYYLMPEDFAGIQQSNGKIKMKRAPDKFEDVDALKKFFQL